MFALNSLACSAAAATFAALAKSAPDLDNFTDVDCGDVNGDCTGEAESEIEVLNLPAEVGLAVVGEGSADSGAFLFPTYELPLGIGILVSPTPSVDSRNGVEGTG